MVGFEGLLKPRPSLYQPFTAAGLRQITDGALRVLAERGLSVLSSRGREALDRAGATVDEATLTAKLPRSMVEDAIASAPSSVTLYSRDGLRDAVLDKSRVHFGTGGTAIFVLDPDTGEKRPSTVVDLILNARLVQALDFLDLMTINVFPNEIQDVNDVDVNRFFHSLDHMTKHVMGGVYSLEGCKKVVRMAELIAGSREALRERPFVSFITLMVSPLRVDGHYGDIACYLAEQRLPVVLPTMPIAGLTSPITLAGTVLICLAETLAGLVLAQSVNKGTPCICGSCGTIMNLESMAHVGGAVERAMIQAGIAQLARHLEIPLYSTAGTTDAKEFEVQASFESALSNLLVSMSGADYIHDSAGLLEAEVTVSYDKLVTDNEILGMCRRVLRGIEVSDDTLAVDTIIEKGPGEHFAADEHTLCHMRGEFFIPRLANRSRRETMWPGDDARARAHAFVKNLRTSKAVSTLDPQVRQRILEAFPEIRTPVCAMAC